MSHRACWFALVAVVGCGGATSPTTPPPAGASIVVLNGYGATGLTIIPAGDSASRHLDFGSAFDGATFAMANDSVLSTSSKAEGDQLYVADLTSGSVTRLQLPAASDPAGAAFLPGAMSDSGHVAVALRDSMALAQVRLVDSAGSVTSVVRLLRQAGQCPDDVFPYGGALWAVDANEQCTGDYHVMGAGRLVRVPLDSGARDTIPLGSAAVAPVRAFVVGTRAYVLTSGDFSTVPGAVVAVDLDARTVVATLPFPGTEYGVGMRLGADGALYAVASGNPYAPRLYRIDPATMQFTLPAGAAGPAFPLVDSAGQPASCDAATADAAGQVICVQNGNVSATVAVFDSTGHLLRTTAGGSLAFDVATR